MTYFLHLWNAAQAILQAHPTILHYAQAALHWLREHATVEDATSLINKLRALDWLRTKWRDCQRQPRPGQVSTQRGHTEQQ